MKNRKINHLSNYLYLSFGYIFLFSDFILAKPMAVDLNSFEWSNKIIDLGMTLIFLSLLPMSLIACTCFTRIIMILSFLRTALGVNQSIPNSVLLSIGVFLSIFIMKDTFNEIQENAFEPYYSNQIDGEKFLSNTLDSMKKFMLKHVRLSVLSMFNNMSGNSSLNLTLKEGETKENIKIILQEISIITIIPSFIVSEIQTAFTVGFMIFLPFLIIDIVVASMLMAMGIMMLPPVMISLPIKIIFFVSVEGWEMLINGIVRSYTG